MIDRTQGLVGVNIANKRTSANQRAEVRHPSAPDEAEERHSWLCRNAPRAVASTIELAGASKGRETGITFKWIYWKKQT